MAYNDHRLNNRDANMLKYEVNLEINSNIYDEFMAWLIPHIKELLGFNGFLKADLFFVKYEDSPDIKKVTVDYYIDSFENYQDYINRHAPKMRNSGIQNFDGQFSARRRVLEINKSFSA